MRPLLVLALALAVNAGAFASPGPVQPRGIRNNNAGNVAAPASGRIQAWPGAYAVDDAGYMIFRRPVDGVRAIVINLRQYHRKHGIRTVRGIVRRWTNITDTEVQREAYAAFICKRLGVRPDQRLNMSDPRVLRALTRAIVSYENGQDPYPAKLYDRVFPTTAPPPPPPAPAPRPSGTHTAA